MNKTRRFPFESARRVTGKVVREARRAIEQKLGTKRKSRGRPPKNGDKYLPISIRLHPKAAAWAKKEATRRGVGYQTVINEVLLKKAARKLLALRRRLASQPTGRQRSDVSSRVKEYLYGPRGVVR